LRIKLSLLSESTGWLTLNYQYQLAAAIYAILSQSSPAYSAFLHDHGYLGADGKLRKLFTFSRLQLYYGFVQQGEYLRLSNCTRAELYISSPMINEFIQHLVVGLFTNQKIIIENKKKAALFRIERIEVLPNPEFTETCRFLALSPIVLTTTANTLSGMQMYYYRPFDEGISEAVRASLLKKHETIYNTPPENTNLTFTIDREYITRKGGQDKVSKLIHIKEGHEDETRVKAFLCPFYLTGSKQLMQTAWDCGLGDKTSMGFGCVEVGEKKRKGNNYYD